MTTAQIANKYHELATQNKWLEIQEALHDEQVTCTEPEKAAARGVQVITQGRDALKAKSIANRDKIETLHSQYCSAPVIAGNFFSVSLKRDVTFKNQPRMTVEEIGLYEVKDGKIISEQFFY